MFTMDSMISSPLKDITKQGFVQKEIRFALDIADEHPPGRIFIIPVRLVDCDVPDSPPEMAVGESV